MTDHVADPHFEIASVATCHLSLDDAIASGDVDLGAGARVSPWALFCPFDRLGVRRTIRIGPGAEVGAAAILHGGTSLAAGARVEDRVIVGQPELGYALRTTHPGRGVATVIGSHSVLRAGAVLYAGARIGDETVVGHHTLVRSHVQIGSQVLIGHGLSIERGARIGDRVRCSPGSHITADTHVGDEVFLGAGVRTVNDNTLQWQVGGGSDALTPPRFGDRSRVGSGAVILGGVHVEPDAVVGAGAVVLRDVAAGSVVVGNPARLLRRTSARDESAGDAHGGVQR